jgi:hypothetical protein
VQLFPAARVLPQGFVLVVWPKSPLVAMLLMFSVTVPVLVSVTGLLAAVVPTTTLPHASDVGDTVTVGPVLLEFTVRLSVVVLVSEPDTPWIVTVTVPVAAVALAVKVSVLVVVAGLGANPAVTPLGKPEAESVTLPLKPFCGVMVMVLVPWLPCVMVTLFGEAERLKFCAFTVRLSVVVLVSVPDVPEIVTVTVPVAAVALAVKVSVLVVVAGLGANPAVTPLGKPEAESVTLPLKPFSGVMVIVLVPLLPCVMVTLFGLAESVKFGVDAGQLFARLAAFTVPIPVAKSQPVVVP